MDKNNLERAYSIIEEAEKRAEELFQNAVNETLPRQLKDIPIEEHLEFYRRKSKELREWYKDHYQPYFDVEKYGKDRIAGMIRGALDSVDQGRKEPNFSTPQYTINILSQRIMTIKYVRYLKELIDGPAMTPGKLEWKKSKTDLIRLLVALHDIHVFGVVGQEDVIKEFSRFLNRDLSNYEQLLSHAMSSSPLETNVELFDKLIKAITKRKNR